MTSQITDTIFPLLKKNKRGFVVIFCLSIIISITGALQPYIIQNIIDNALLKQNLNLLYILVGLSFGLAIFAIVIKSINEIFYTKFSINILFKLREQIFYKIFLHDKTFLNKFHSADLLTRLQGDISELQRFFTDSFLAIFSTVISLVIISCIIYTYNIQLMILILIFLPIEFFCVKPLYKYMHNSTKDMREKTSETTKFFVESLRYLSVLKTLGAKDYTITKLNCVQDSYKETVIKNKKLNLVFSQIPALISLVGKTLIILYGGYLTIQGELKVGELVAFLTYFAMILSPVHTILGVINNIPKLKVSLNRVSEILPKSENSITINEKSYDIKIHNVSFAYGNNQIFEDISLELKQNTKIALIGKNGSGKSTLSDLLCGIESPTKGKIFIGNTDITKSSVENISEYIVKMEQVPVILDTTLENNLTLGKSHISKTQILTALEQVNMLIWYKNLKDGLDTKLIESGENLSVGQRQRLAMARIILLNPKIVILDEFTSAIDSIDKKWFYQNINNLFKNSSVIVISHELDMLDDFDFIYTIENKNIKEFK